MTIWMAVSTDNLELPEAVADTPHELGKMVGVNGRTVITQLSKYNTNKIRSCRYRKVEVEEDE